ncbi:MAG: ribosome hibernation-promoting factor, HPF/YfiA family [Phycisphaerales bacterium]
MRIDVVGKNTEITDAIRQYGDTKASKLLKYYDRIQLITIRVTKANASHTSEFEAELILDVEKHADFVSNAHGKDPYAAIDLVVEKGERQLREFKERLKG